MNTVWFVTAEELPRLVNGSAFCFAGKHYILGSSSRCTCGRWWLVEIPDAPTGSQESAAFWEEM